MPESITLPPPPVFFIKSISEQGYTLSTAIADLIDNSLAAGATRVELLMDTNSIPLRFFVADNGNGMSPDELTENMRFPSADLDEHRADTDLGRFGLGMKTASFSQSRKFSVISRKPDLNYAGRTWDVAYLNSTRDWTLIKETDEVVDKILAEYQSANKVFHERDDSFTLNTLVVWSKLYKLEKLVKKNEIVDELEELRSHLGLVFHRFIQGGKLKIRLNNSLVDPFEPFPDNVGGVTVVSEQFWKTDHTYIRFQGIILPKRSATEAKESVYLWVPAGRTLEEFQGLYVYRNDRLINYGGWLRTIPKSMYLQFGRIRIDISNISDSEFHLNVAKSSLKIPFGLKRAMKEMVTYVAGQASKEYRERLASSVIRVSSTPKGLAMIIKESGAAGTVLKINNDFEILRKLTEQLNPEQNEMMSTLIGLLENKLNQVWQGESYSTEIVEQLSETVKHKIINIKRYYEESEYTWEEIRELLMDSFGRNKEVQFFIDSLNTK